MSTRTFRLALALVGLLGTTGAALADGSWEQTHQRRDEVNDRLEHQNARIEHERREHEMSRRRAHELHEQDARIRERERAMAAHDNGHITRQEQERLNGRENAVSREIGR